jgi:pSer/pThr/pTyr-binding forkhead associated (FHA) protein
VLVVVFSRGKKQDGSGAEEESKSPLGAAEGPPGATMVLSTVPRAAAWLVVRSGGTPGKIHELMRGQATIGRGEDSDIQLEDASVGSPHALIKVQGKRYLLYDLGSNSGTWVNGKGVTGAFLRDGSRISMGASEIFFTQIGDPGEGGAAASGVLLVRSGPSMGQSFPVGDGDLVIGRRPGENGARIDDTAVSLRHALVRPTPHGVVIYDLGSANGTSVDDVSLAGVLLENGDIVKLGRAELQFVLEEPR